jgi:hypothetical protein
MTSEGNLLPCSVCQATPTDTYISQIILTPTPAAPRHSWLLGENRMQGSMLGPARPAKYKHAGTKRELVRDNAWSWLATVANAWEGHCGPLRPIAGEQCGEWCCGLGPVRG